MSRITDPLAIERALAQHHVVILQYGSESCAPCHAIRQKIDRWQREHSEALALYVSVDDHVAFAAQQGVLSVPTVIAYVGGQEVAHKAGYFSLDEIFSRVEHCLGLLNGD